MERYKNTLTVITSRGGEQGTREEGILPGDWGMAIMLPGGLRHWPLLRFHVIHCMVCFTRGGEEWALSTWKFKPA